MLRGLERMNKKIEILLVEDNEDDAELIELAFKEAKIIENSEIHVATDGESALEYMFNTEDKNNIQLKHHPNLILLDLRLPKLDGLEVLKKIKEHPKTKDIPLVALTGSKDMKDWTISYNLGVNCFLRKPTNFSQLVEAIGWAYLDATDSTETFSYQ